MPWSDVCHERAHPPWLRDAKKPISAENRLRRVASAIHGSDRTDHRNGHHQAEDSGDPPRRPLHREWTEGLDIPSAAFRAPVAACTYHAARGGEGQVA